MFKWQQINFSSETKQMVKDNKITASFLNLKPWTHKRSQNNVAFSKWKGISVVILFTTTNSYECTNWISSTNLNFFYVAFVGP
jgi:hypothetical protein